MLSCQPWGLALRSVLARVHEVAQHESLASFGGNLVVKVDEDGAVVRPFDRRLNVARFDPGEQTRRDEHVVDARPIIRFTRADLRVPTWVVQPCQ